MFSSVVLCMMGFMMKTITGPLVHMEIVGMRFGELTIFWRLQFLIRWVKSATLCSFCNFQNQISIFATWLTCLPKCRLHGFRWTATRTHKWVRGSVGQSRFQILSAKLVSEGGIPSPVVLACAFLTWQSLETMAKGEQSRHSSAVT